MSNQFSKEQLEALMKAKLENSDDIKKAMPLRQVPLSLLEDNIQSQINIETNSDKSATSEESNDKD